MLKEEDRMMVALFAWREWMMIRHPELKLMYHVPNERHVTPQQGALENAKGRQKGVPDVQLDVARNGYHGLRIEMKTQKGKLSEEQKQWGEDLNANGYRWVMCRSLDAAIKEIVTYLGIESSTSVGL